VRSTSSGTNRRTLLRLWVAGAVVGEKAQQANNQDQQNPTRSSFFECKTNSANLSNDNLLFHILGQ